MENFQEQATIRNALAAGFHGRPILVAGDLILDRYIWGEVSRISPEAPVPVVRILRETETCGATAHVAVNLANLGIVPRICGWVGNDPDGERLKRLMERDGVDTTAVHVLDDRPTIVKTRVISARQQMLRLDREETHPPAEAVWTAFVEGVLAQLRREPVPGAVVLSDYGKGTLTEPVCQAIIQAARRIGVPVLVDPKGMDYSKYRGATTLTPNRRELAEAIPMPGNDLDALLAAGETLRARIQADFLTVTLSELGIALLEPDRPPVRIPATAKEVFDVSGAGDAVIAVLAAGIAGGFSRLDAIHLANLAGGVVVGKVGTSPIQRHELLAALSSEAALAQADKIRTQETAMTLIEGWRHKGERIVFTNGCFDLLHAGHVTYLEKARKLGSRLVVGLNTDRSVRAIKGPTRPVIRQEDRARVLAALESVDLVIPFDEPTPLELIRAVRPAILAKGADYTEEGVVGGAEGKAWGCRVALIPLEEGRSSSNIMQHIQSVQGAAPCSS
ncbi:MAG: D-glycero-beta-D-manno-heptose 1-phosphate adenylyltransferase [Magnetococcales bacterium]|nr:D-glycero-beta-D-manno-heptose 1-phosphate adenylyltransferase [Magnetococcales bacterium]